MKYVPVSHFYSSPSPRPRHRVPAHRLLSPPPLPPSHHPLYVALLHSSSSPSPDLPTSLPSFGVAPPGGSLIQSMSCRRGCTSLENPEKRTSLQDDRHCSPPLPSCLLKDKPATKAADPAPSSSDEHVHDESEKENRKFSRPKKKQKRDSVHVHGKPRDSATQKKLSSCSLPDEDSHIEAVEDRVEASVDSFSYDLSLPQEQRAMGAFRSDANNSAVSPFRPLEAALEATVESELTAEEIRRRDPFIPREDEAGGDSCIINVNDPRCASMYREEETTAVQEVECSNGQLRSSSELKRDKELASDSHIPPAENDLSGGLLEGSAICLIRETKYFYKKRSKQLEPECIRVSSLSEVEGEQRISLTSSAQDAEELAESSETAESIIKFPDTSLETMNKSKMDNYTGINLSRVLPKFLSEKSSSLSENSVRFAGELMNVPTGYGMNKRRARVQDRVTLRVRNKRKFLKDDNCTVSHKAKISCNVSQAKWRNVNIKSTEPANLIGCKCKVYWPDDKVWYAGLINAYNAATRTHRVDYKDGDHEDLDLASECVRFYVNQDEIVRRNLVLSSGNEENKNYQEMTALATALDDYQEEFGHGELVWAKIKGHPMWPAFVMDEEHAMACGLDPPVHEHSLAVQFFGSYDYARLSAKNAISFSEGLIRKLHSKCKKVAFDQGLKEAQKYMKEGKLPDMMSTLQEEVLNSTDNEETSEDDEDCMGSEWTRTTKGSVLTCPITIGDLKVLCLGKIVRDSEYFHNENQIWTEGYIAVRRFSSIKDPNKLAEYKMEVKKDPRYTLKPLFCISFADNEKVEGPTPSSCWRTIYQKIDKIRDEFGMQTKRRRHTGEFMFGFSNPQISKLIQMLPYARACFKFIGWFDKKVDYLEQIFPAGYKPVEVDWKHADRCGVCGLEEEYTNNLFLQCDKCRIMVHMHCYGEYEPPNGNLWLCQLCRPGSPAKAPLCCLCPIQGGAMKRTTDSRWAHLTCAMWIPETCFQDIKHMEPIDGLNVIHKERWKLTCSICKVPYGVCIQCSEPSCYVSFHVLCAKSSGFVFEVLEDPSHKYRGNLEEVDQPVQLFSYCKKHRPCKVDKNNILEQPPVVVTHDINGGYSFCPPKNVSGCARTEPYDPGTRRGRQEPEIRAAASVKRLYVEKIPYRVGGFSRRIHSGFEIFDKFAQYVLQRRQVQMRKALFSEGITEAQTVGMNKNEARGCMSEDPSVFSVADRYQHMCDSLKRRLTFGKSAIHGWGVFTKQSHRAGDMVIEYAGELVRPIVADLREKLIYNKLVGAGTYMFRIDDEHVVDATREGSIAHLINHSCEPNCFSRVVAINGEEHIIIFAKRDIEEGEELSYDYRFTSKGEQLECFCGFPSCRGFVNVDSGDEDPGKILVPCSEITQWRPAISESGK